MKRLTNDVIGRIVCRCMLFTLFSILTLIHAQGTQENRDIDMLFKNFFAEYIALKPETGTSIGVPISWGVNVKNGELDDESEIGLKKVYELYRKYHNALAQCNRSDLSSSQRVAVLVLSWFLENELQGERFRNHNYLINPMYGFHPSFISLMTGHHRISKLTDATNYIARLKGVKNKVTQILERLDIQKKNGVIPPSCVVETYWHMLNEFVQVPPEENIIYTSFRDRLENIENLTTESKNKLCRDALDALRKSVYPGYARLIEHVASIREISDQNAGVWKLPEGDDYYQYCLRSHTTTNMSPEEIHNLGFKEVARIKAEMVQQFQKLGITGSSEFKTLFARYREITGDTEDERYFFPATQEGMIRTALAYQAIIDSTTSQLPLMFSKIPKTKVHVARVPEYKAQTVGTYYQPPKLDGSEGGIFYTNLSYQHQKSGMKSLTYHEAIPGHHFQIALEQEQLDAQWFKSLFFFTGYVEGWALYAEKLAGEYGFYQDIHSLIGYLRSELFRAARLVIDTGIHHKKWTREQAYQYLYDTMGWSSYSEIDRYIMWPGQACAYKVGELKILELRALAVQALGEKFDIKEFHDVVLKHGSVPLDVLEQMVNDYIRSSRM